MGKSVTKWIHLCKCNSNCILYFIQQLLLSISASSAYFVELLPVGSTYEDRRMKTSYSMFCSACCTINIWNTWVSNFKLYITCKTSTYVHIVNITHLRIDDMRNSLNALQAFQSLQKDPPCRALATATGSNHHQSMMNQCYLVQLQNLSVKA